MCCVLGGVVSALIGNVLLTGAVQQVYSSCDIAVTFIQSAPAAASPPEAQRRPTWAASSPQRAEPAMFELAHTPLLGNFCCLCRKATGDGSDGAAVSPGQDGLFPPLVPFRKHILLSLSSVKAQGNGGKTLRHRGKGQ